MKLNKTNQFNLEGISGRQNDHRQNGIPPRRDNTKLKIIFFFIVVSLGLAVFFIWKLVLLRSDKPPETYVAEIKDKIEQVEEKIESDKTDESDKNPSENQLTAIPEKIFIEVPFTSQAPYGVWDEKHEEACEEAAIIILKYYFDKKDLTKKITEKEIQRMIDYEIKNYGDYKDSTSKQVVKLAEDFYGISNLDVIYDFSKEDIKKELAKGNPVIIPVAGRKLGNPYYTQPGPLYHMLVLVGYSGDQIITNDPGTRRGEGYRYDSNVLYGAIHDFPGDKNKIGEGRKAMITVRSEK